MKNKFWLILLLSISVLVSASAVNVIPHVVHGRVLDGTGVADGSIVTAYLKSDPTNFLTDLVGLGNYPESGMWKVNLYNMGYDGSEDETLVVSVVDGNQNSAYAEVALDPSSGTQQVPDMTLSQDRYALEILSIDITDASDVPVSSVVPGTDYHILLAIQNKVNVGLDALSIVQLKSALSVPLDIFSAESSFEAFETVLVQFDYSVPEDYAEDEIVIDALCWNGMPDSGSIPFEIMSEKESITIIVG